MFDIYVRFCNFFCHPYLYEFSDDDKLMFRKFDSSMHDHGEKIGRAIHISNDYHFLLLWISDIKTS